MPAKICPEMSYFGISVAEKRQRDTEFGEWLRNMRRKSSKYKELLILIPLPSQPWFKVEADLLGDIVDADKMSR